MLLISSVSFRPRRLERRRPDDLDELLTKVWKEPAFFLTHPRAIARLWPGVHAPWRPPPTVSMFGSQFITWRGIPLVPSDKMPITDNKTKILLLRTGEKRQGVGGFVSARFARRAESWLVGAVHGDQPPGDCLVSDITVLLTGHPYRRCGRSAR